MCQLVECAHLHVNVNTLLFSLKLTHNFKSAINNKLLYFSLHRLNMILPFITRIYFDVAWHRNANAQLSLFSRHLSFTSISSHTASVKAVTVNIICFLKLFLCHIYIGLLFRKSTVCRI